VALTAKRGEIQILGSGRNGQRIIRFKTYAPESGSLPALGAARRRTWPGSPESSDA